MFNAVGGGYILQHKLLGGRKLDPKKNK
ncbi:hypothetical protein M2451_002315, partial [Dysgonomonas sp. PFB1-18]|nr:hypothetical protein [Dysgonomonas sp. PFB1-18]